MIGAPGGRNLSGAVDSNLLLGAEDVANLVEGWTRTWNCEVSSNRTSGTTTPSCELKDVQVGVS